MYEIPGKIYSFITMLDQSCGVEELIFDLWKFCYDKDCSVSAILQNQAKSVFIITGIMNSVAAMYFNEKVIDGSSHDAYFDICENLG